MDARIIATLPNCPVRQAMHTVMRASCPTDTRPDVAIDLELLRQACWEETSLWMSYSDLEDQVSDREVWQLGIYYSPKALVLLAFCQLRQDYRMLHIAWIKSLHPTGTSFRPRRVELLRGFLSGRSQEDLRFSSR